MDRELETYQCTTREPEGLKQLTVVWSRGRPLIIDAGSSEICAGDEDDWQRLEEMHADDCEVQEAVERLDRSICFQRNAKADMPILSSSNMELANYHWTSSDDTVSRNARLIIFHSTGCSP